MSWLDALVSRRAGRRLVRGWAFRPSYKPPLIIRPEGMIGRKAFGRLIRREWSFQPAQATRNSVVSNPKISLSLLTNFGLRSRAGFGEERRGQPSYSAAPYVRRQAWRRGQITYVPDEGIWEEPSTGRLWPYFPGQPYIPAKRRVHMDPYGRAYSRSLRYGQLYPQWSILWECLKRRIRKEVLFATEKAGKAGQNPPRYDALSEVDCD